MKAAAWAFLLSAFPALFAADPVPVLQNTAALTKKAAETAVSGFDFKEYSGGFSVRFDAPGKTDMGYFACALTKDGYFELTLHCHPTTLVAEELVLRSKEKLETGKWYDIAFNFSSNKCRYSLYIDGKWQMENHSRIIPQITYNSAWQKQDKSVSLKNIRLYNYALDSEDLTPAHADASRFDAVCDGISESLKTVKNPHLKNWGKSLLERADALEDDKETTIAQIRRLERDGQNFSKIAAGLAADPEKTVSDAVVTSYTVSATSQELHLPYRLPLTAPLSDTVRILAAKGEFESASVLIVPFAPVKKFTLRVDDLKCGKAVIPASTVDVKLVKRWIRCGGAWMNYLADRTQRVLVPDLLVNDDGLIRVDEFREINEVRLNYPEGTIFTDISDYHRPYRDLFNMYRDPFRDADTLQSVALPEAGRNQQYMLTVQVPKDAKDGLYKGSVTLVADGKDVAKLKLQLRVLPFTLPAPKTYPDTTRDFYSHVNDLSGTLDSKNTMEYYKKSLKVLADHNLLHPSNIDWNEEALKAARDAGLDMQTIFGGGISFGHWIEPFGGPAAAVTVEQKAFLDKKFAQKLAQKTAFYKKVLGYEPAWFSCGASEVSYYPQFMYILSAAADAVHANTKGKMMTHGMGDYMFYYTADFNDLDTAVNNYTRWANIWNAAGGGMMNYADPFPGAENPAWYRRKLGMLIYKHNMSGQMLHGFIGRYHDEFAEWYPGYSYRNYALAFRQQDGYLNTIRLIGIREGYDDVRYATLLKTNALKYRDSKNQDLAREAKRQLLWLELYNGDNGDLDMFRSAAAHRIETLMKLAAEQAGGAK